MAKLSGNCGYEKSIDMLRSLFPDIKLDEIPEKLKEAAKIEDHLKKIISQNNLEPPSTGKLHLDQ